MGQPNVSGMEEQRRLIRHSASHVMADAVMQLYKDVKLGIGPATDDGFYYDFLLSEPLTNADLEKIEKHMKELIARDEPFVCREYTRKEALKMEAGQPFKQELINDLHEDAKILVYSHGNFSDLCAGPHVESTGKIPAVKLLSVAGAYWRGDEKRPMLQRIYGTAFETQEALDEYLVRLEEARKRDHRAIGKDLDLFSIHDEIGPGLILWHPKGARIRSIIESFWKKEHEIDGYELMYTPHIGRALLWQTSGHLDFYKDNMYGAMETDGQDYYLKPMNCPFHIMYYQSAIRSYRELPVRIAELGTVYRYERGGVLQGLFRVRGFTQDDAHIFCREDQVDSEVNRCLNLTFHLLKAFGFSQFEVMLSTRPEKAVGEKEQWDLATESLRNTLIKRGQAYGTDEGGGAFYGPKIDVHVRDAIGRKWQLTTVQFDFNESARFGLKYIGEDGQEHRPYMIHRALLGSLERFFGILIEHYAGAFPVWLAPVQAQVIPIAERHLEYAEKVKEQLSKAGVRTQVDGRNERMNAKIRDAQLQKIPYMLVVGDRESQAGAAAVRTRAGEDLGPKPISDIIAKITGEAEERK